MPENVPGIHHVTAICGDVQKNVDFYVNALGLRFIKKTVNFDVPDTYHLYYADWLGTPGTAMTFFGWPHLPWRAQGSGQITLVSFAVPPDSIGFWMERFRRLGVECSRSNRFGTEVIALRDPDRMQLELVGEASDERWVPWREGPVDPVHAIRGFHSVTLCVRDSGPTGRFLGDTMGFSEVAREGRRARYKTGTGGPAAFVDILEDPTAPPGEEAVGTVHHVAWRARDDEHQLAWRELLVGSGREVTPVIDRKYFHSIYFREPGGVLFEIATDRPGFTVDEPAENLGGALQLPPQIEDRRETLGFNLPPITVPAVTPAGAPR